MLNLTPLLPSLKGQDCPLCPPAGSPEPDTSFPLGPYQEGPPWGTDTAAHRRLALTRFTSKPKFLEHFLFFAIMFGSLFGVFKKFTFFSLLPRSRVCVVAERQSGCILKDGSKSRPAPASALFYLLWNISNDSNQSELKQSYFIVRAWSSSVYEGRAFLLPLTASSGLTLSPEKRPPVAHRLGGRLGSCLPRPRAQRFRA